MFTPADPKQSFPKLEEQILAYWKEHNIFKRSLENRKDAKEYSFYDGPPFATGTPHYGHLLGGMLKDVMPRYQTMRGHYVERRFGWDCHGLPIENLVEKKLGISGKRDIEDKIGISAFNEACRENIFTYVDVWRQTVERMGRWVDMDDDYKTMDPDFMESVWWVFKSVFDKGLIYESRRVVHYCPRCSTPLSNFEVNQGYADKQDKAVTVKFKLKDQEKFILAWTTTPWTLPANLGLAVGEDIDYVELRDVASGEIYILASECISTYYKKEEEYAIERTMKGKDLLGLAYEPIIPDVQEHADLGTLLHDAELGSNVYHVIAGHHVTTDSGTGIVHIAPAFGEDDFIIGERGSLGFFAHIDAVGNTQGLLEDNGVFVFEYNDIVIRKLKEQKKIIHIGTIDHSYPFCYRCDTPLIFRAIPSWYLAVEKIKDRMIANNVQIRWIPDNIKHGRFGKWLEGARDWNISRNRYWGTPLPVWKNEDGELLVIGSMKELFEYNRPFGDISEKNGAYFFAKTGAPLDLHKHFMDEIRLSKNGKTYTRIPEVLDCWFESGSMPYCQKHYPFENKERFEKTFPADFIAEGLDQTRGWFYTLLILGTALFDKPPFLNVIVNGIILAEDGKKMSKRLKNYPDPDALMSKHGADAIRFYMLNSPVVKADDLRFSERGVEETVKSLLLPLWNTLSFFTTYANIDGFVPDMTEVSFVRHGEVDHNRDNRLADGNIDPDLNATGIEQAKKLAMDLRNSASSFDVIISSPQIRARHTAEIIAQQLGYQDEIRIEE
jgi:isoleucyl-tRNA synthetase